MCRCVLFLIILHVNCIIFVGGILQCVVCPAVTHFLIFSYKRQDFRENKLLNVKYVFGFFSTVVSKSFFTVARNQRNIIIHIDSLHVKYPLLFSDFNLLATEFFFQILAHLAFKTRVIQKPNKVALWNKRHFEEEKMEIIQHV